MYDFEELNTTGPTTMSVAPKDIFVGSYPPITPPGEMGDFFVNTYYLQSDRKSELAGPVPVRQTDLKK
jgi:hypothetical protein